ncbi:MAG: DNA repair protein RecO [Clostridia bacterium]|nr:DNA repair protein RecO [Clostridia bacterium]
MEEKLTGIVLNGISYGESDKILSIYTLENGIVSAKIKGVKKAGAKLKFASEPFCFAEFIFSSRGDKRTVIGASLLESFYPIREDIVKYYAGATVLEFVRHFSKENIVNREFFISIIDCLKELSYGDSDATYTLAKFLIFALRHTGYALNFSGCSCCGNDIKGRTYFDYNSGGFYCEECFNGVGREINPATLAELKKIENGEALEDKPIKSLRLIDYYLVNKTEENLSSLKELLRIIY